MYAVSCLSAMKLVELSNLQGIAGILIHLTEHGLRLVLGEAKRLGGPHKLRAIDFS